MQQENEMKRGSQRSTEVEKQRPSRRKTLDEFAYLRSEEAYGFTAKTLMTGGDFSRSALTMTCGCRAKRTDQQTLIRGAFETQITDRNLHELLDVLDPMPTRSESPEAFELGRLLRGALGALDALLLLGERELPRLDDNLLGLGRRVVVVVVEERRLGLGAGG